MSLFATGHRELMAPGGPSKDIESSKAHYGLAKSNIASFEMDFFGCSTIWTKCILS